MVIEIVVVGKKLVEEMDDFFGVGLIKGWLATCLSLNKACYYTLVSFPSSLWERSDHPTSRRDTPIHSPCNRASPVGRLLELGKPCRREGNLESVFIVKFPEQEFVARFGWSFPKRNPKSSWKAFLMEKIVSCYPKQSLSPFASNFPGKTFGVSSQFCRL